ncbi:type II toxin-antitoxin system prevent-host-death family antitoxin [Paenarthrobacter sp. PH39-S1]|uniref:type II toxin-antitoxin system Phd/YefM family antitoxin n=1 Tax=Paenarthrobacter sp. PH39-S1 TaxID=3046204 RepID=UPI0024BB562A|nr:type II toxin-antitoxin system prevent-host-death family antitoxin [Paenarthrobacter sp. PH39-S1]MDJ0354781.1 type II toxin-antitoxin system prevent-host-death family antitoxin [Paenarthrobacter sp. PH39-S1]
MSYEHPDYPYHYRAEPYVAEVDQVDLVNMGQYNVQETKTRLSELLNLVENGEDVVIAKAGKPVARLVRIERPTQRRLGFVKGRLPEGFLEPAPEEELQLWEQPLISSTPTPLSGH